MRTLPEIARTHAVDVARHAELLALARSGDAGEKEIGELSVIDGELHAFGRMCRRWAPISATELGFRWGETLTHEQVPDASAIVRECALVEQDGELVDLLEATRRLPRTGGGGVSLGGWRGSVGAVGDLAGLRPIRAGEGHLGQHADQVPDADEPRAVPKVGHGDANGTASASNGDEPPAAACEVDAAAAVDAIVAPGAATAPAKPVRATRKKTGNDNYDLFG